MSYKVFMNKEQILSNPTVKYGDKIGVGHPNSHIVYRVIGDKEGYVLLSFQYIV